MKNNKTDKKARHPRNILFYYSPSWWNFAHWCYSVSKEWHFYLGIKVQKIYASRFFCLLKHRQKFEFKLWLKYVKQYTADRVCCRALEDLNCDKMGSILLIIKKKSNFLKQKWEEKEREEMTLRTSTQWSLESWKKTSSSIHRIVHDGFKFHRHFFFMFYNTIYGNQRERKEK